MPEVVLQLEWPDGRQTNLYSPSTVMLQHLQPGERLSVADLQQRAERALGEASERVRARYGFACTRTDEERSKLRQIASAYTPDQLVRISAA